MDYVIIALIVFLSLLALVKILGYGITLGAGEYQNKGEWEVWASAVLSGVFYIAAAFSSFALGYNTVGAALMGISLFFDYLIGWIVDDNVVTFGNNNGFIGVKYTILVLKTILLAIMAYLGGVEAKTQYKFPSGLQSRFVRDFDQGGKDFLSKRRSELEI